MHRDLALVRSSGLPHWCSRLVLALRVCPDDEDICVPRLGHHSWKALTMVDAGIEVQAGAKDVAGFVGWWQVTVCFDVALQEHVDPTEGRDGVVDGLFLDLGAHVHLSKVPAHSRA